MLAKQAHTLDAIFNTLARRANNAQYLDKFERYLKLALKAQAQSRSTWEALARIKNPPIAGYVRQANIAHGPQQVNNEAGRASAGADEENATVQDKLLDERDDQRLDGRETGASSGADQGMAAVDKVDRSEDASRKGAGLAKWRQGWDLAHIA